MQVPGYVISGHPTAKYNGLYRVIDALEHKGWPVMQVIEAITIDGSL